MDSKRDPSTSMEGVSDGEDSEMLERRHRRDFAGTEKEKLKKGSRKNTKKRHRPGLTEAVDTEEPTPNSTEQTPISPPALKKKSGPIGVKGATRSFNVVLDNEMTPEAINEIVIDESKDGSSVASSLAAYLWEPKTHIFRRCLSVFSREQIAAWLKETIEIERGDGMATITGARRKTPGGVFFTLVARDANDEQKAQTVGIPRIKGEGDKKATFNRGTLQGKKPKYTALEDLLASSSEDENTADKDQDSTSTSGLAAVVSTLDPSRAKRNPFAPKDQGGASSSKDKSLGTIFGSNDEDLGEAV